MNKVMKKSFVRVKDVEWAKTRCLEILEEIEDLRTKHWEAAIERRQACKGVLGHLFPFLPDRFKYPWRDREQAVRYLKNNSVQIPTTYETIWKFGYWEDEKTVERILELVHAYEMKRIDLIYLSAKDIETLNN